jgi:hypothetical protein
MAELPQLKAWCERLLVRQSVFNEMDVLKWQPIHVSTDRDTRKESDECSRSYTLAGMANDAEQLRKEICIIHLAAR